MIFHFFWTILKSKTNSKKANKSSNTKQDILDIDKKEPLELIQRLFFQCALEIASSAILILSFSDKYLSSIHYINSRREILSKYISLVKTTRD